ncbi:hypothetical protein [Alloprevotella sp. OH1205_COT-284]|uniref:hypothetical protein n=1 Tax=Alloprevotella sp. OH1205_COT-284 TaxID=2491043 RepID=UPI000F5EB650|nr:hypothetical protein [Alloprevotella sp. OH1205_COT-284]
MLRGKQNIAKCRFSTIYPLAMLLQINARHKDEDATERNAPFSTSDFRLSEGVSISPRTLEKNIR